MENQNVDVSSLNDVSLLQERLSASEWYLGEAKEKIRQLESLLDIQSQELKIKDQYIQQIKEDIVKLTKVKNDAEWFLGEEREKRVQLEKRVQDYKNSLEEYEKKYTDICKKYEKSEWYLNEQKSLVAMLRGQLNQLMK